MNNNKRIHCLFACLCICSLILVCRLFNLQVTRYAEFKTMAMVRDEIPDDQNAYRGGIYDRTGREMALTVQSPSAFLITRQSRDPKGVIKALSSLPWINARLIRRAFDKRKGFVWIKRKLNPREKDCLERLHHEEIQFVMESERFYPNIELAGQVIGFVGTDGKGLEGLEFYFNELLEKGFEKLPGMGIPSSPGPYFFYERKEFNLVLTIDLVMQFFAEDALRTACEASGAEHGLLIIMDACTGEIYALANWPGFNPNHFTDYHAEWWRNRCITSIYEPGSIFKLIWAAALLKEKQIHPTTPVYCEMGSMNVAGKRIRDHEPLGLLRMSQVLEKSSNVGSIKCAQKLGKERFYHYIRHFGFGEKTGIDFPGEVRGILREPGEWSGLSLASMAIGQEISITPIQMITAFCALVNGGRLMKPLILKEIRDAKGNSLFQESPRMTREVISPETSMQVKRILRGVVTDGTGVKADVPGYLIGGKTGTAQIIDRSTGEYSHEDFLASFIGFFPDLNARWAMLVMVNKPRSACWGGDVAAPVFREVAKKVIRHLGIPPIERKDPKKKMPLTQTARLDDT